jgi:hypothetical protein
MDDDDEENDEEIDEGNDRQIAFKVFSWLVYGQRLLSMRELQEALYVRDDTPELIEKRLIPPKTSSKPAGAWLYGSNLATQSDSHTRQQRYS